jgi:hypothetical protein
MATTQMQRQVSPIPPGRYWICIVGRQKQADFDAWINDMRGGIQVETASMNDLDPSTEFLIFRVPEGRSPFLDASYFGYPNTAPPEITSLEDVERTHREPNPIDQPNTFWGPGSSLPSFPGLDSQTTMLLLLALVFLLRK